jgi:hypothetical protein
LCYADWPLDRGAGGKRQLLEPYRFWRLEWASGGGIGIAHQSQTDVWLTGIPHGILVGICPSDGLGTNEK